MYIVSHDGTATSHLGLRCAACATPLQTRGLLRAAVECAEVVGCGTSLPRHGMLNQPLALPGALPCAFCGLLAQPPASSKQHSFCVAAGIACCCVPPSPARRASAGAIVTSFHVLIPRPRRT